MPPDAVADLVVMLGRVDLGPRGGGGPQRLFRSGRRRPRVGESLSPLPFSLRSDPFEPGLECTPFLVTSASGQDVSVFDNGLPLERTEWISGGRLARLQYHRAAAAASGVAAGGAHRQPHPGAAGSRPAASRTSSARTERGLLLTCLWYIREVDPATLLLTGLTRDGVYLVEHGEIVGSVNNFRFNESPVDLLAKADRGGTDASGRSRGSGTSG